MIDLKASARRLVYGVADAISPALPALSDAEQDYLGQLRAEVLAAPASNANDEWAKNLILLRDHVAHGDPRSFLRWPVVMRTMAATQEGYVLPQLWFLLLNDWRRWRHVVKESPVGHPYRYLLYPASSGNLIHIAYHLATFEKATGQSVHELNGIVEFGGGYGCMCRATRRLGYKGPYFIFDLPEFSALQRYYLRTAGIEDAVCVSDPAALEVALKAIPNRRNALFIATWSLSEAPIETRKSILDLTDAFGWFLIGYQNNFAGVDNERFFADAISRRRNVAWTKLPVLHQGGTYLIGQPI